MLDEDMVERPTAKQLFDLQHNLVTLAQETAVAQNDDHPALPGVVKMIRLKQFVCPVMPVDGLLLLGHRILHDGDLPDVPAAARGEKLLHEIARDVGNRRALLLVSHLEVDIHVFTGQERLARKGHAELEKVADRRVHPRETESQDAGIVGVRLLVPCDVSVR